MKHILLLRKPSRLLFWSFALLSLFFTQVNYGQTVKTYDFGTGTATISGATTDASASFPATQTGGGSIKARIGTGAGGSAGSFTLANPGNTDLGTATELQFVGNGGSTSATKFGLFDYTASKVGYLKFKIIFNGSTSDTYGLAIGDGATMSDNSAVSNNQIFAGIQWAFGASNAITYQVLANTTFGTTNLPVNSSTTLFTQGTALANVYSVEIYYNNTTSSQTYSKGGTNTLGNAKWDLWVNGTKINTADLAKGALGADVNIDSFVFYHQVSTAGTRGTLYIDDIEYSDGLPTAAPTNPILAITALTNTTYGSVCTNATAVRSFTITNTGTAATNVAVTSSNPQYTVSNLSSTSIAATNGTATFDLIYTPITGSAGSTITSLYNTSTASGTIGVTGTAATTTVTQAVSSSAATAVVNTTATLNGNYSTAGVCPATTEKGFVYSVKALNANPLVGGGSVTKTTVTLGTTGTYTLGLTSLTPGTIYTFKAYVYNGTDYTYGGATDFTTLDAASKLVFSVAPPTSGISGTNLTSFTVQAQRPNNTVDTEFTGTIALSRTIVSGTASLAGTTSLSAVAGVATFSAAQFNADGVYKIIASSGSLTATPASADITIVLPPASLSAWNFSATTMTGAPPTPATNANVTVGSLTRGPGVITSGTSFTQEWGGYGWSTGNLAAAVTAGTYLSFTIKANAGYKMSLSNFPAYQFYSSTTGPDNGQWQYSIDGTNFINVGSVINYTVSGVNSVGAIDLSSVSALQNLPSTTTVTFRNYGYAATNSSTGTYAFYDGSLSTAADFSVLGYIAVAPVVSTSGTPTALNTVYGTASGTTQFNISGTNLTASNGITVTPPVGFEVSTLADFSSNVGTNAAPLHVGGTGTVSSTAIYVRLPQGNLVASYSGDVVLSSAGATSVNVAVSGTVTQKGLTITGLTVTDKTFDGTTLATLDGTATLSGVLPTDTANVTLTGSTPVANFDTPAVGNNKPVTVSGYVLSGSAASNYSLTQPSLTGNIISSGLADQTITFAPLTAVSYGVAPYALTATSDSGLQVTYTSSNENVATVSGSTITIVGVGTTDITASQDGNSSFNPAIDVVRTLTVNPKELTVSGATASDKIYDTDTTTAITGGTLVGVINSDDVSFSGNGNFDDPNVGDNKPVTANLVLSGAKAGNYYLTQPALSADITPKELTITGIAIATKEYDTTDSATITGTAALFGVEFADAFSVSLTGSPVATFNNPSVGTNKPVSVTGYAISGSSNYYLTQPSLTGNITLRTVTIVGLTAQNKVYDRTLPATLSGTASLSGVLPGDETNVVLSGTPSANFLTFTVGNNKQVPVTGYSLSGSALANYTLAALTLQANITKLDVTISGASVADKLYDGTTTATLSGTLSGVIPQDLNVTLNKVASFADAFVGTNKPVTSTSTITGTDSGNYNLVQPTGLTASITAAVCTQGSSGVVTWDFGTTGANAAPSSNPTGVTISNITSNNNLGTVATPINNSSVSTGYPGASGAYNIGAAARTGALNTAAGGSAYFEFTITPTSGSITFSEINFGSRSTGTAPLAYSLRSSADGYTTDLATGALSATSAYTAESSAVSAAATASPVTYRLYGHSGAGSPSSGTINWRIDDLKLTILAPVSPALSSPSTANVCSGTNFTYTPTTSYSGATITWTRAAVTGISNAAVTTPQSGNVNETLVNTTNAPVAVVYTFKVTGTTCYVTGDVTVTVNSTPIVTASDVSGCAGSPINLVGSPAGGSFSVTNPYVGTSSTTYTYSYTDGNGCSATSTPANITITAQPIYYLDADNDHYYTGSPTPSCTSPGAGYTTTGILGGNDCDDANGAIHPNAAEICWNGLSENCNTTPLSQGCAPVVVNMTPSYNGMTLTSLSQAIPAVAYSYGGFTNLKYRFTITNVNTGQSAVDIIQTSRYVVIPTAIRTYNTSYTVTASAVINEEIVPYAGNTVTVNAPTVTLITLGTSSCGATLATLASTLTANPGLNATGYTFRIRLNDLNPSPTYYESQSATRFVSANTFAGFPLQYGSSYKVSVQFTFNDPLTNLPVQSGYGAECTINTPVIPVTTIASPTCNGTVTSLAANMSATAAPYATGYRFRIRLFADNGPTPSYFYTLPNASRFSTLSAFQGTTLAYSTAYSISVEYSILNGSTTVWSGFGAECKVTTPFFPTTSLVPSQCGTATPTSLTQQLNITPYPGFPNYKVRLEEVNGEEVGASQEITVSYPYFKLNQFSIAQLGKNYQVSVAIKLNGVFGDFNSPPCDLFTAANGDGNNEGGGIVKTMIPFKATAYPNPFANNFMIDVKTESQSNVNIKVYDMIGRMIEQRDVRVSDMESATIGNEYPSGVYNVVVSQEDSVQIVRVVKR